MTTAADLDQLCINTLRTLSIDAVQKANSGHPGTPMGAAPTAYCLWQRFLRYSPEHPDWPNRDRFVLSSGHACALLYSMLHLTGVRAHLPTYDSTRRLAVELDDLKSFRQEGSRCTGHPEYGWTSGVEITTGPLGQGVANSVGMAIAGAWMAATYNRPQYTLFDYNVYALCGDGDMMEGISSEAASLAGHLGLSNLCWIYDDNHISIEGNTRLAFTEDIAARFSAYGWHVEHVPDANDLDQLDRAYKAFLATGDKPTLIIVRSHIGYGSPHRQDTREAHGEALGEEEVRLTKEFYGMDPDAQFAIAPEVPAHFAENMGRRGDAAWSDWVALQDGYERRYPDLAAQLAHMRSGTMPDGWDAGLPEFGADAKGLATRASSGKVLNAIAANVPWLIGGAADLSPSTKTNLVGDAYHSFQSPDFDGDHAGRNFHFGIREHAMCAIANGMAVSEVRPFASSFFVFTDYCRPSLRLSAMMEVPVVYVWTHDSISLGEDGPTHQPIEQLPSLRAMPGMVVIRPADANEVVQAWKTVMPMTNRPVSLVLTRQALPTLDRAKYASAGGLAKGAYVLADADDGQPRVLLLASGSEVALCVAAHEQLKARGIASRVVSMPSWELFEEQDQAYKDQVLPPSVAARVSVEQAAGFGWERYTGTGGTILSIDRFGLSAPGAVVSRRFGFDADHVVEAACAQVDAVDAAS
jgi:transketolase